MKIKYTTYDVRRDEDVIHVNTQQCNLMLLNGRYSAALGRSVSPYIYGKVLGIFHANVSFSGVLPDGKINSTSHRLDFCWVHWYDSLSFGEEFKLDRVRLLPLDSGDSLGFVDPTNVIRGVHIIPRFSAGLSKMLTPPTKLERKGSQLWKEYYINKYVRRF